MGTSAGTSSLPPPAPNGRRERRSNARFLRRLIGLVSVLVASLCILFSSLVWHAFDGLSSSSRRELLIELLSYGALGALLVLALGVAALRWFILGMREASEQPLQELASSSHDSPVSAATNSRFLSQLLADMGQDIRTPMNAVLGMTQLVLRSRLDPTQERQMRTIDGAARALLRMLNDILDFSKLEADRYELVPMGCSLHDVFRVSADLLEPAAKDKGIALELQIAQEVPDQVLLDAGRLQQVLINLAQNAIDRTHAGSVKIQVRASKLNQRAFELGVRIADTGVSVPIQQRMGPIARKLLALMRCEIRLVDGEGSGAVLEVLVPVHRIAAPAVRVGEATSPQAPLAIRLPSPAAPLLVVDADGLSQMVAVELLENLGFEVEVASSCQQAIEQVERKRYALILMDCQMPERGGYRAAQRIRALQGAQNRTPIIGCSRSGSNEDRSRAVAAGLDDHLNKPLERSALCNVLARWLPDEANPASSGTRLSHTGALQRATAKGLARQAPADSPMPAPDGATPAPDGSTLSPDGSTSPELLPRERSCRLEQVLPGNDPEDFDSDPYRRSE